MDHSLEHIAERFICNPILGASRRCSVDTVEMFWRFSSDYRTGLISVFRRLIFFNRVELVSAEYLAVDSSPPCLSNGDFRHKSIEKMLNRSRINCRTIVFVLLD